MNVSDLLKGNNVEALNNALNKNNVEVARVTNVLNNNTVLGDFLKNNNIAVSRVVAIDVLGGGGRCSCSRSKIDSTPTARGPAPGAGPRIITS